MAFGAGWTPCIGPILASILFVAGSSGSVYRGAALLFAFSTGLGVPFILAGLFFSFFQKTMVKVRPHLNRIKIGSGLFLIIIGILIFSGQLSKMNIILYTFANNLHNWEINHIIEARAVYGSLFLIPALFTAVAIWKPFIVKKEVNWKSSIRTIRTGLFSVLLIIAVLTYTGLFEIGGLIQKWLTFQGI
jgi:cytochrome c-type biogenesis protein